MLQLVEDEGKSKRTYWRVGRTEILNEIRESKEDDSIRPLIT